MDKSKAAQIVNNKIGTALLNQKRDGNVCWANINVKKDVWWIDIPVKKFKKHLHLILNEDRKNHFFWISIPANDILEPYRYFRKLRENYISIELSCRETNKFVDVKSGGTEFNFNKFQIEKFDHQCFQNGTILKKTENEFIFTSNEKGRDINQEAVKKLENEMAALFEKLSTVQQSIKEKLIRYCDNKTLKGNEIVGWLGEIYGKLLFQGKMVDDSYEHDVETVDGKRISIKTRKGWNSGWTQSSAIPKIVGDDCPTHLLFVHLNDDFSVDGIWLFSWNYLTENGRFRKHIVRENLRSYIFHLNESNDRDHKIFPQQADHADGGKLADSW